MGFGTSILLSNTPNGTTWSVPSSGFANPSYLGGDINTAGLYQSDGFQIEQGTSLIVAFEGTYTGAALTHQQTMDPTGATGWFSVVGYALDNSGFGPGVSTTGVAYAFVAAGVRHRIQVTALSTGTLVARASLSSDVIVVGGQTGPASGTPGTPITADSGNKANSGAVATLPAVAGKTTYITGFVITASGATAALVVTATVAGTISGTMSYTFVFPAGVTTAAQPLNVSFPEPVAASAVNTAIVVTLPASGAGGTNATVNAQGFQL